MLHCNREEMRSNMLSNKSLIAIASMLDTMLPAPYNIFAGAT